MPCNTKPVIMPVICLILILGCANENSSTPVGEKNFEVAASTKSRNTTPAVGAGDIETLVLDNARFALGLYRQLASEPGNLFYSPHSISMALAMTWAGAAGDTESQVAATFHFSFGQDRLHSLLNALDLALMENEDDFRLNVINAAWGQSGYTFLADFLDVIAEHYGAGMNLLNFSTNPDGSRRIINSWVEEQTVGKIRNLLPESSITTLTRLVLTNAIYFKADWLSRFTKGNTHTGDFHLLTDGRVSVEMMRQDQYYAHGRGADYQIVELPYAGNKISMLVLLPDDGAFQNVEQRLDAVFLSDATDAMSTEYVSLALPRFSFHYDLEMVRVLQQMGMVDAFDPGLADFSGINGDRTLHINSVLHKAFVAVDEQGTEAAAATGVVVGVTSAGPASIQMTVDRPFVFMIRDKGNGAILFVGRVLNPTE